MEMSLLLKRSRTKVSLWSMWMRYECSNRAQLPYYYNYLLLFEYINGKDQEQHFQRWHPTNDGYR